MARQINEESLFALFEAAGIDKKSAKVAVKASPVDKFLKGLESQRAFIESSVTKPDAELGRGSWVKKLDGYYLVKIGASPLTIKDKQYFKADNKKDVLTLFNAAEKLIRTNEDLQRQIIDRATERASKRKKNS